MENNMRGGEPKRLQLAKGTYRNKDAVKNVVSYITRTRENEPEHKARELRSYGGCGVSGNSPEDAIFQMEAVQKIYGKTRGRKMLHEFYLVSDDDFEAMGRDYETLDQCARILSSYFYAKGYQTEYAVHESESLHAHIHFAVNPVNFMDGKKINVWIPDLDEQEKLFDEIVSRFHKDSPLYCIPYDLTD